MCLLSIQKDPGDTVSAPAPLSDSYAHFVYTITNNGTSTATHLSITENVATGTELVGDVAGTRRDGSTVTCGGATCTYGNLPAGGVATIEVVLRVTAQTGTFNNTVTANVDERGSDNQKTDPKQDATTFSDKDGVSIVARGGIAVASYVPADKNPHFVTLDGTGTGVASPGTHAVVAGVNIPAVPKGLTARLTVEQSPFAFTCPSGATCGTGGWVHASVPDYDNTANPLNFPLRFDASVLPKNANANGFYVFYVGDDKNGANAKQVFACTAAMQMPCLQNTKKWNDGDISTVLVNSHNGYMRR